MDDVGKGGGGALLLWAAVICPLRPYLMLSYAPYLMLSHAPYLMLSHAPYLTLSQVPYRLLTSRESCCLPAPALPGAGG